MKTIRSHTFVVLLGVALCFSGGHARGADDAGLDGLDGLNREVAAMRGDLAALRLRLDRTLTELEELKAFVALGDGALGETLRLEALAAGRASERTKLVAQHRQFQEARETVRRVGRGEGARAALKAPTDAGKAGGPKWDIRYQVATIPSEQNDELVYIDPEDELVLLRDLPTIDRTHLMVRGTIQNRSSGPWRATFEVRVGDRSGNVIGQWRYQTPLMDASGLHEFEVKVPVSDVAFATRYEFGNLVSDGPGVGGSGAPSAIEKE